MKSRATDNGGCTTSTIKPRVYRSARRSRPRAPTPCILRGMKNFLLGLSISGAFILGCAAAHLSETLTVPPATAAMTGPRWEVLCIDREAVDVDSGDAAINDLGEAGGWDRPLKEYGAQGWEPFQLLASYQADQIEGACFRRPIQ